MVSKKRISGIPDVVYPERMNMFLVDPYMTASIALWAMDITPEGYDKTSMLLDGYSIPDIVSAVTGGALEAPDAVNCQNPQYVQTLASVFAGALGATKSSVWSTGKILE